jgi:hypothetical protein
MDRSTKYFAVQKPWNVTTKSKLMKIFVSLALKVKKASLTLTLNNDNFQGYVKKPLVDCTSKPCPRICITLYSPVCATNGVETKLFGNECELQSQNECVAKSPSQGKL